MRVVRRLTRKSGRTARIILRVIEMVEWGSFIASIYAAYLDFITFALLQLYNTSCNSWIERLSVVLAILGLSTLAFTMFAFLAIAR